MTLAEYTTGKNNNFNIIRFAAAVSVLISHSVPMLGLPSNLDPFVPLGFSLGEIAVNIFFITSGFLITASLLNRNIVEFVWARILRIFPALWLMLLLTVLVLGAAFTTLPVGDYFAAPATRDYFIRCATIVNGVRWALPGVFEANPLKGEFNGSLWTLPLEFRMYEYFAAGWLMLTAVSRFRLTAFKIAVPLLSFTFLLLSFKSRLVDGVVSLSQENIFLFLLGSSFYLWRGYFVISKKIMYSMLFIMIISTLDRRAFSIVYLVALAPIVMHLAYLPDGLIRNFNRIGDYSYGVYIYAYPVQQALVALHPTLTLPQMIVFSSLATFALAAMSWHFLEKKILARKEDFAAATFQLFYFGLAKTTSLRLLLRRS